MAVKTTIVRIRIAILTGFPRFYLAIPTHNILAGNTARLAIWGITLFESLYRVITTYRIRTITQTTWTSITLLTIAKTNVYAAITTGRRSLRTRWLSRIGTAK
jgi:hypothetical protein